MKRLLLFVLAILLFLNLPLLSQSKVEKSSPSRNNLLATNSCKFSISTNNSSLNLGNFYNGYSGSDLPGMGGSGNSIEFNLVGNTNKDYLIHGVMEISSENNSFIVDSWTWDFTDKLSPENYYYPITNQKIISKNLTPYQFGASECESIAKIRLTINHITIKPDAKSGNYSIYITVTVTE